MNHPDSATSSAAQPLGQGVVLAMHCVPASVDPAIEAFWARCSAELAQRGFSLILVSTVPVSHPLLNAIDIPYLLTDFSRHHGLRASAGVAVDERDAMDVAAWYQCPLETAQDALRVAREFLGEFAGHAAAIGGAGLPKRQPGHTGVAQYRGEGFAWMNRESSDRRTGCPLEMRCMDISLANTFWSSLQIRASSGRNKL